MYKNSVCPITSVLCILQSSIFDMVNTPYKVIDLINKIQAKYENKLGKDIPWYSSAV